LAKITSTPEEEENNRTMAVLARMDSARFKIEGE
jgi:hypothetical protein